jgi:hypothetical protein
VLALTSLAIAFIVDQGAWTAVMCTSVDVLPYVPITPALLSGQFSPGFLGALPVAPVLAVLLIVWAVLRWRWQLPMATAHGLALSCFGLHARNLGVLMIGQVGPEVDAAMYPVAGPLVHLADVGVLVGLALSFWAVWGGLRHRN